MEHSKYQEAIFTHFTHLENNAAIDAVAGSGKTYTLIEGLKHVDPMMSALVCAFNKDIRTEFSNRISRQLTNVSTYNAFGWGICRRAFPYDIDLDPDKTKNILEFVTLGGRNKALAKRLESSASRLISLAKNLAIHPNYLHDSYQALCDDFSIEVPKVPDAQGIIVDTYRACVDDTRHMDFDDQIFMPIHYDLPITMYDLVLVDEYQDTSPIQSMLMARATRHRQIVAGDPWQAIYNWRGATPDAMAKFMAEFKAVQLPLSICYRCPKRVIALAQGIVKHIEAAPNAPDGIAEDMSNVNFLKTVDVGDFVLCRNTAPLIQTCLQLIKAGKRSFVKGREIGVNLIALIDKVGGNGIEEFLDLLKAYQLETTERLAMLRKEQDIENLNDRVSCLLTFAEISKDMPHMREQILSMFSGDSATNCILLMTIHKSKGLQARRVFIITPDKLKEDGGEESRVKYVALTRAMEQLWFVRGGEKDGRNPPGATKAKD